MGSGKTTIGRRLARRLNRPFRDSDVELSAAHGRTAREIAASEGVARLHELEADQLLSALAAPQPSVIAAAASTIEDRACRDALRRPGVAVVWLRAEPTALAARLHPDGHRPELGSDPVGYLAAQAARRHPLFESVRPIVIDIGGASARELGDWILDRLDVAPSAS